MNTEFHDVLPGSSIQCGEDNGLKLLDHGLLEAERLKTRAIFALSSVKDVSKPGEYPVFVFNPHPYTYTDTVECEFMLQDQNWSDELYSKLTVLDKNGNKLKYQVIKEESNLNLDWRKRIAFEAELKPLELNRFSVFVEFEPIKNKEKQENLILKNFCASKLIPSRKNLTFPYFLYWSNTLSS